MPTSNAFFWKDRLKASGIHFGISLVIALLAALLVFGLWYPYPYREISGGRELFLIVVAVDVVLGPLITLAVFNRAKPWRELRRDLVMVALIQLSGLGYGLWTVFVARPVHMVFEYDRFRVVHAVDVPLELLAKTPPGVDALPLLGPTLLSLRPFRDSQEKMNATLVALEGLSLSAQPNLWQPYAAAIPEILREARPVSALKTRFANQASEIDRVLASTGRAPKALVYLPMVGRKSFWTVFLDPVTAEVLAFMPLDSF
ncbi:MAG: TfpX/TfpZ family type IV pilin accessory protein [Rhodoferax sp.]|uniref:TfpX/TfpZ family type IV pilin accessory protein n=1 Tax=Rhodoferax sp. TaxID=50421 RepID=UPI00271DAD4C|nr:TfpX/TfpZ family type IV pilin accessory protein [Rhodoferax sp.]MDO8447293.1 TfpX/TfpZ family type IV pilin accessory protein [Rhodoferax sp.]